MSKQPPGDPDRALILSVVAAIRRMQGASHEVDRRAARSLGVNPTDLAILGNLESGPRTPTELARLVHITPASTTVAMGRLAKAGWITREASSEDGRSRLVSLTPAAKSALDELYGPIRHDGMQLLGTMTPSELKVILDFLEASTTLQMNRAESIPDSVMRPAE